MDLKREFYSLRKELIEKNFSRMNNMQREAVLNVNGPLLILAGAGSGKTTVIVNRILNLIKYGNSYNEPFSEFEENIDNFKIDIKEENIESLRKNIEKSEPLSKEAENILSLTSKTKVWPSNILAITFTNKAAKELKERVVKALGERGRQVWVSTFHSMCNRILRKHADKIGFDNNFTIYDEDDTKKIIKECLAELKIDEKNLEIKTVKRAISGAKDSMVSPEKYQLEHENDYKKSLIAKVYSVYQQRLRKSNSMDFDDLIPNTITLLKNNRDVLDYYWDKFKYIMVDEYQDTNKCQYELVRLLSQKNSNICVVGDDDQSIYKFRGATIENILNFENNFKDATVIKLEQNYRSTGNILDAANGVIGNNKSRKSKALWTSQGKGEKVHLHLASDQDDEARYICNIIKDTIKNNHMTYKDFAVLYRVSALSSNLEKNFIKMGVPHRIVGEHRFFDRKEIKDIIAYLSVINNPNDTVHLLRIINQPKRSIGQVSIDRIVNFAEKEGESLLDVMRHSTENSEHFRSALKLKDFANLIDGLIKASKDPSITLPQLFNLVLEKTKYIDFIKSGKDNVEEKIQNIKELGSSILLYYNSVGTSNEVGELKEPTLAGFLEEVSLLTGFENSDEGADAVSLMTVHAAKGLEFPFVFLVGLEEGLFPSVKSYESAEEIEEERRLAYVGFTRAKENLYITRTKSRMLYASLSRHGASRFLKEIPQGTYVESESEEEDTTRVNFRPKVKKTVEIKSFQYEKGTSFVPSKQQQQAFHGGDRVKHKVFGEGVIVSCKALGSDTLVEINFKNIGNKKLMAKFAKLERV